MTLRHGQAVWLMVAVTLMWSIAGVVTRHLQYAQSFEVTFWRSLFTVVSLVVILPFFQGRGVFARILRGGPTFWVSGVCWSVMFTALVARIFLGYRIPPRTWIAIVVAGCGIAYMFGSQLQAGSVAGTLVALCVPVAGAINWTVTQRSQAQGRNIDLVPAVLVGALISSLTTLPLAMPFQASARDIGLLAMLGLVQLAIPCALSVICARVLKAPEISLLALLEVIFGILLAWIGAGEVPGPTVFTGGALVIGALLANELAGWRQRA